MKKAKDTTKPVVDQPVSPPDFKLFSRDENGLLKNVEYKYREDGYIDWRAMVDPQFLGIKDSDKEKVIKKYGDLAELDLREVDDKHLFIYLGGVKDLAKIRGFKSVKQEVNFVSTSKSVVTCSIEFIGNYETSGETLVFSDTASASYESVHKDFTPFLESIAANRAFVRCVRNALGINIVGKDELSTNHTSAEDNGDSSAVDNGKFSPQDMLKQKAAKLKLNFAGIKAAVLKAYAADMTGDVNGWNDFSDISNKDCYVITQKINQKIK